jgi:hypothetical protein
MSVSAIPPHVAHARFPRTLHVVLWVAAAVAGVAAARYAYSLDSSFWLALFVFLVVSNPIARAAALTEGSRRLVRAGLIAVFPVVAVAICAVVSLLSGPMWLAVVLGLAGGLIVQGATSRALSLPIAVPNDEVGPGHIPRWVRGEPGDIETRMR